MVACAIVGCSINSSRTSGIRRLFLIPKVVSREGKAHEKLTRKRRLLWVSRINRKDLSEKNIKRWTRVCGRHFVSGAPSKLYDVNNRDWAPSINLGYDLPGFSDDIDSRIQPKRSLKSASNCDNDTTEELLHHVNDISGSPTAVHNESDQECNSSLNLAHEFVECCYTGIPSNDNAKNKEQCQPNNNLSAHEENNRLQPSLQTCILTSNYLCDAATQTDLNKEDLQNLENERENLRNELQSLREKALAHEENNRLQASMPTCTLISNIMCDAVTQTDSNKDYLDLLEDECQNLRNELLSLREKVINLEISEEFFRDSDEKVRFYTGLPTYSSFNMLFTFLCKFIDSSHRNSLTRFQEYVMLLMRLRLNLPIPDLAYRFSVSQSTITRVFDRWLNVSSENLRFLVNWPDRDALQKSMPLVFIRAFGKRVVVILNCFEMFIEKPSSSLSIAQSSPNYRQRDSVKFLIGITPQGTISFVSNAWEGEVCDKYLIENSGVLKNLLPHDVVITNKGFDIQDSLGFACAELLVPSIANADGQLQIMDVNTTKKMATLKTTVERVIGLVRKKFKILQNTLPISMFNVKGGTANTNIDKIAVVCSALCNLCNNPVPLQ